MAQRPSLFCTNTQSIASSRRSMPAYWVCKSVCTPFSCASKSSWRISAMGLKRLEGARVGVVSICPCAARRSRTSSESPAIMRSWSSKSYRLCQTLTRPAVAIPPKQFCFSTTHTLAPSRAARTAANRPVQLPPSTHMSPSQHMGICRAGSQMVFMMFFLPPISVHLQR